MSFILDALKKSEREREQQATPMIADAAWIRRHRTQPVWIIAVIALLVLNFGVLAMMWLRSANPVQPAPTQITVNNLPGSAATTATVPATAAATEVRPLSGEAETLPAPAEDETAALLNNAAVPEGPQLVRTLPPGDASGMYTPAPNASTDSKSFNTEGVSSLEALGGAAALNIPELHLDIHVYADNPAGRFVFINMRKYTEGQPLKEGPLVERINRDGVVLSYRNQRFQLARQ